ncbi:MAG: GNAT family N-acetyltransferase [Bacteroidota bacterium]
MKFLIDSSLSTAEKNELIELWNKEYPIELMYSSTEAFDDYLSALPNLAHILLIDEQNKIRGWYFDFEREGEKWFGLILDTKVQNKGLGTRFLKLAQQKEKALNAWVIQDDKYQKLDGDNYRSPLNFYLENGFKMIPENKLEGGKIAAVKIKWTKN